MIRSRIALLLVLCLAVWSVPVAFSADAGSVLVGKWKLNEKQSNKPEEEFMKAMREQQQSMRERHGKHGGGGDEDGDEARRGPGGGGGRDKKDKKGKEGPLQPDKEMTISYAAPDLKVKNEKAAEHVYHTNGQKSEWETADGRNVAFWAHWEDLDLIVEGDTRAGRVTETWSVSPDGKQLYRKLRVQSPFVERPVYIVYAYDREGGASPSPQSQTAPATP